MRKLAVAFALFNLVIASACMTAPQMPDIEIGMIDAQFKKVHVYMLPKRPGLAAKFLRSVPLSLPDLDLYYVMSGPNYSTLEEYATEVEAWAKDKCQ